MTLENFINLGEEKAISFDFKFLYNNKELKGSTNIETICNYKLLNKKFDCDSEELTKDICNKLFPNVMHTDTLNSWQNSIKRYLNYFHQGIFEDHYPGDTSASCF